MQLSFQILRTVSDCGWGYGEFRRTCLGNCNNVKSLENRRNGILLDRGREVILSELNVAHHGWVDAGILKL
jgi:hypothetical protein